MPSDWQNRMHRIQNENTRGRLGLCLDVVDLFLAKASAARPKDRVFCMALLKHGYVTLAEAVALIPLMPAERVDHKQLRTRIRRWANELHAGHDVPAE